MKHELAGTAVPISQAELLKHLSISKSSAKLIAKTGLKPVGSKYPWPRIWRAVHDVEGAELANHLATLQARHPNSLILNRITDLEKELKRPLWNLPVLAGKMGWKYDAYRKAIKSGRVTLPAPMITLGGRKQMFRPFEVVLMRDEGIRLDLPKPSRPKSTTTPTATRETSSEVTTAPSSASETQPDLSTNSEPNAAPEATSNAAKKDVFGAFAAGKRRSVA